MKTYMESTASIRQICKWKCAYCGKTLIGVANISAKASQRYGYFRGPDKDQAAANARAEASSEVYKRIRTVNYQREIPDGVRIDGKCPICGHKQPWVYKSQPQILLSVLSLVLGFAVFGLVLLFGQQ